MSGGGSCGHDRPHWDNGAVNEGLGPHCVGRRVVVRRVLPGETGPSGGPAFTDVIGIMEGWDGATTTVVTKDGRRVTIPLELVVSGKPVPPPPPPRPR